MCPKIPQPPTAGTCGAPSMTSQRTVPGASAKRMAQCACGLAFPDPWDLVAHFLTVYPPSADQPAHGKQHADVTRLAVKLDQGATGAWEVGTWATSDRRAFRVAAAITYRAKTGDLAGWQEIRRKEIRDTYQVSMHVAAAAVEILKDWRIAGNYGGRVNLTADGIDETLAASYPAGQMLYLIASHVAMLEDRMSGLIAELARTRCARQR